MGRTIGDLKVLRAELVERRRKEAYWIHGAYHEDRLAKIVDIHTAITAIDAVIDEGQDEPESEGGYMIEI